MMHFENTTSAPLPGLIRRASRALFVLAGLLLAAHVALYIHYAVGLMRFPFDYDQGEGFELVDTIMFSEGHWPYQSNETYPFYSSNYPPLFHVILVPFVWIFGEAYWYGRLMGFLGTLVTATTIGWVVLREGRDRRVALLAGMAFLASNYIYHVGPLFRQHLTMVMFETLSVAVLAHASEIASQGRRRRMLALGLALMLAAGFTKQLALASAVAVFVFLFIRNPRRSLAWGVFSAAAAAVIFLGMNWSTGGEWWNNAIAANVNDYYPAQFIDLFKQWFRLHRLLIVPAGLLVVYEIYFARLSLYSVWWVFAVADTALSGKWGAGDSYFATAIAATCVLSGIIAARTVRGDWTFADNYLSRALGVHTRLKGMQPRVVMGAALLVPLVYIGYGLSVIKMPTEGALFGSLSEALGYVSSYGDRYPFYDAAGFTQGYATIGHVPTQTDIDNGWRIVDIVREGDKPALSEEAAFSLRAGKDVISNPTQLKNLYENALLDPANLIAAIQAHEFNVVVFRAQFYPQPVLDAVYRTYYPEQAIVMNGFTYEIWRPGPEQGARDVFAEGLSAITAEGAPVAGVAVDDVTVDVDLTYTAALQWSEHMLDYYGWSPVSEAAGNDQGCVMRSFTAEDVMLAVTVCPGAADGYSTITLALLGGSE